MECLAATTKTKIAGLFSELSENKKNKMLYEKEIGLKNEIQRTDFNDFTKRIEEISIFLFNIYCLSLFLIITSLKLQPMMSLA